MFFRWHGKTLLFLWCSIFNCPTTSTYHSMTFGKLEKRSRSYNFMLFFLTIQFVWAKNSVQWLGLPGSLPSGSHHPDLYFFLVWELCKPSFATGILGGEATQATPKVSTNCLFFGGGSIFQNVSFLMEWTFLNLKLFRFRSWEICVQHRTCNSRKYACTKAEQRLSKQYVYIILKNKI